MIIHAWRNELPEFGNGMTVRNCSISSCYENMDKALVCELKPLF